MNSKTNIVELWVRDTVKLLVNDPDAVEVEFVSGTACSVISVKVAREDTGIIIGRSGIMADAFRTFLNTLGKKFGTRYVLQIED